MTITKGMTVRYPGGSGIIERTSTRTGVKLYRVENKWFERKSLEVV